MKHIKHKDLQQENNLLLIQLKKKQSKEVLRVYVLKNVTRNNRGRLNQRQVDEAQKLFDVAHILDYDITELLTLDLVETNYLFDVEGLTMRINKTDLCSELEKP